MTVNMRWCDGSSGDLVISGVWVKDTMYIWMAWSVGEDGVEWSGARGSIFFFWLEKIDGGYCTYLSAIHQKSPLLGTGVVESSSKTHSCRSMRWRGWVSGGFGDGWWGWRLTSVYWSSVWSWLVLIWVSRVEDVINAPHSWRPRKDQVEKSWCLSWFSTLNHHDIVHHSKSKT